MLALTKKKKKDKLLVGETKKYGILFANGDSSTLISYLFYAINGLKDLILARGVTRFLKAAKMLIFEKKNCK